MLSFKFNLTAYNLVFAANDLLRPTVNHYWLWLSVISTGIKLSVPLKYYTDVTNDSK